MPSLKTLLFPTVSIPNSSKMTTPKHTPTPWHYSEGQYSAAIMGPFEVYPEAGRPLRRPVLIAQFGLYTDDEANHEADARHAVHCVNALPGVVAALERMLPDWEDDPAQPDGRVCCEITYGDLRAARAALKEAQ